MQLMGPPIIPNQHLGLAQNGEFAIIYP